MVDRPDPTRVIPEGKESTTWRPRDPVALALATGLVLIVLGCLAVVAWQLRGSL